jgi:hypothetical protein
MERGKSEGANRYMKFQRVELAHDAWKMHHAPSEPVLLDIICCSCNKDCYTERCTCQKYDLHDKAVFRAVMEQAVPNLSYQISLITMTDFSKALCTSNTSAAICCPQQRII